MYVSSLCPKFLYEICPKSGNEIRSTSNVFKRTVEFIEKKNREFCLEFDLSFSGLLKIFHLSAVNSGYAGLWSASELTHGKLLLLETLTMRTHGKFLQQRVGCLLTTNRQFPSSTGNAPGRQYQQNL